MTLQEHHEKCLRVNEITVWFSVPLIVPSCVCNKVCMTQTLLTLTLTNPPHTTFLYSVDCYVVSNVTVVLSVVVGHDHVEQNHIKPLTE